MASVRNFMITRDMKAQLADLGYPLAKITTMRPEEAWSIIERMKLYTNPVSPAINAIPAKEAFGPKETSHVINLEKKFPPKPNGKAINVTSTNWELKRTPEITARVRHELQKTQLSSVSIAKTGNRSQLANRIKLKNKGKKALRINERATGAGKPIDLKAPMTSNDKNVFLMEGRREGLMKPFKYGVQPITGRRKRYVTEQLERTRMLNAQKAIKTAEKKLETNFVKKETVERIKENVDVLQKAIDSKAKENLIKDTKGAVQLAKAFFKNPWTKRVLAMGTAVVAFNLVSTAISKIYRPESRAIPEEYSRGYDILRDNMTDFGSPLSSARAAQKTITPYYSTVRNAMYTTVNSTINKNYSLMASKNAIKHTRY